VAAGVELLLSGIVNSLLADIPEGYGGSWGYFTGVFSRNLVRGIRVYAMKVAVGLAYDVDPRTLDARVPSLILQPLVESAVRYGVEPHSGPRHIRLSAALEVDRLGWDFRCISDRCGHREGGGGALHGGKRALRNGPIPGCPQLDVRRGRR
jgi:hypothetical protein